MKNELQTNEYVNTTARIKATLPSSPRQFSKVGNSYSITRSGLVITESLKECRERMGNRF